MTSAHQELRNHIRNNLTIPVIASSGAGKVEHFSEVFEKTKAEAALAAGIFHREEVPIEAVKEYMRETGIETIIIVTISVYSEKAFPDDFRRGYFYCLEMYGGYVDSLRTLRKSS